MSADHTASDAITNEPITVWPEASDDYTSGMTNVELARDLLNHADFTMSREGKSLAPCYRYEAQENCKLYRAAASRLAASAELVADLKSLHRVELPPTESATGIRGYASGWNDAISNLEMALAKYEQAGQEKQS